MKTEYSRDSQKQYLVLSDGNLLSSDAFPVRMLTENEIPGFLSCRIEEIDSGQYFLYDITSLRPLRDLLRTEPADRELLRALLRVLADAMETLERYLLPADYLQLQPELIFLEKREKVFRLVCCPDRDSSFGEQLQTLSEFLLHVLQDDDRDAVVIAYSFYQKCRDDVITSGTLRQLAQKRAAHAPAPAQEHRGSGPVNARAVPSSGPVSSEKEAGDISAEDENEDKLQDWLFPEAGRKRERKSRESRASATRKKSRSLRVFLIFLSDLLSGGKKGIFNRRPGHGKEGLEHAGPETRISGRSGNPGMTGKRTERKTGRAGKKIVGADFPEENVRRSGHSVPGREMPPGRAKPEHTVLLSGGDRDRTGPRAVLLPEQGSGQPPLHLERDQSVLGRNPAAADLVISSPLVSRVHARLRWMSGRYCIEDVASRNGTWLNGRALLPGSLKPLESGDELVLGDRKFRYEKR